MFHNGQGTISTVFQSIFKTINTHTYPKRFLEGNDNEKSFKHN